MIVRGGSGLAEFILHRYRGKVVEVGAGNRTEVAAMLARRLEVVVTDRVARDGHPAVIADDIFMPRKDLYRGASLLYSIRPPLEMQLAMGKLAMDIGAEMIIRPLGDEIASLPGFGRTLVNTGDARFYIFKSAPEPAFLRARQRYSPER